MSTIAAKTVAKTVAKTAKTAKTAKKISTMLTPSESAALIQALSPTVESLALETLATDGTAFVPVDPTRVLSTAIVIPAPDQTILAVNAASVASEGVLKALDASGIASSDIQDHMVLMFDNLSKATRRQVLDFSPLRTIFEHGMRGLDRKALILWVETYTPVRIFMHDNGRLDHIGWSASYVTKATNANKPAFDIASMKLDAWWTMAADVAPPMKKTVAADKLLDALVKGIARASCDTGSVAKAKQDMLDMIAAELDTRLTKYMVSESFATWSQAYFDQNSK